MAATTCIDRQSAVSRASNERGGIAPWPKKLNAFEIFASGHVCSFCTSFCRHSCVRSTFAYIKYFIHGDSNIVENGLRALWAVVMTTCALRNSPDLKVFDKRYDWTVRMTVFCPSLFVVHFFLLFIWLGPAWHVLLDSAAQRQRKKQNIKCVQTYKWKRVTTLFGGRIACS